MGLNIFASALINNIVQFEVTAKLLNKKINHFSYKYLLSLIILTLYVYFCYSFTNTFIRTILLLYVIIICIYIIFHDKEISLSKIIVSSFINWLFFLFSELIFAIFATIIFKFDYESIKIHFFGNFICNCSICIIYIFLLLNKFSKKIIINLINKYENSKIKFMIIFVSLTVIALSITFYLTYFKINFLLTLTFDFFILAIYIMVIFKLFDEKYKSDNLRFEYNILLNNLDEYEKMLEYQKIANHENKNELLVIKGMAKKNNKDIVLYIDSIIKERHLDSDTFIYKTNKIPSGGLRGLIYYKVLLMKEKNINVELEIDNTIKKINFDGIGTELNRDLCRIMGVMIDNAIEAVASLEDKYIKIVMNYDGNEFKTSISNNIIGTIDISNIDNPGYTTKENGHGYGLSLVKQLIEKNNRITNKRKIDNMIFTQIIIVKII